VSLDAYDELDGPTKYTSHLVVTRGRLYEISSVLLPRFDDARTDQIAASRPIVVNHPAGGVVMSNPEPDPTEPDQPDQPDDGDDVEASRIAQHLARTGPGLRAVRKVTSRYSDIGEYAKAVAAGTEGPWDGTDRRTIGFALTDITTADIAGILPPQWVTDFAEDLAAAR